MDTILFHSLWTALSFGLFLGIIGWAWSGKRKASFERLARVPLEDEDISIDTKGAGRHG